jgi:hypothetical protein
VDNLATCKRLRAKLKRQQANLERADNDGKRAQLERNIAKTKGRLARFGC